MIGDDDSHPDAMPSQTAPVSREPSPLHPDRLTWAVLLGRWVDFARSAVALPEDETGRRLRDSVADIIMLQAVWFALQHLHELGDAEQSLGIDRAQVLIEKHETSLRSRWQGKLPEGIVELLRDAHQRLQAAERSRGSAAE